MRSSLVVLCVGAALVLSSVAPVRQGFGGGLLDPRTYQSPSGEYELFVDPSQRTGAGEGRYRFTREGVELWSGARPWTLREVEVTDEGLVAGYAYGAGEGGGEGDSLTIVLLEADGKARLEERTRREGVSSCMGSPEPMVNGLFVDRSHERLVVRLRGGSKSAETWRTYALSDGTVGPPFQPSAQQVSEIGRRPLDGDPDAAGIASASGSVETLRAIEPRHLGTIVLGEEEALAPIHDVRKFGVDGLGRLGALCGDSERSEFLLVDPDGTVLNTLELPSAPGGKSWSFDLAWVGGERWVVTATDPGKGLGAVGFWLEGRAGRLTAIEGFSCPAVDELASNGNGGFVVLTRAHHVFCFDALGERLWWRTGLDVTATDSASMSPKAVTVTSDGCVAVLDNIEERLHVFSRDGEFLRSVDLKEAWGRDPRYPIGIRADSEGGVIVHDFDGQPPVVRMDREGRVTATLVPRFADGNAFRLHGDVQRAPEGTLWTSDGHALLALDDSGVVRRTLGGAPDAEVLGEVDRLVVGPGDRLYAADRRTGSVHVFDARGKRLHVCKPAPEDFPDELSSASVAVTDSGEVFLGDFDSRGHVRFAPGGARLGVAPLELERGPTVKLYAQSGTGRMWAVGYSTLFLLDEELRLLRSIERMPDGAWLQTLGSAAVAPDGSIALAVGRRNGARVVVYSPTGEPLRSLGLPAGFEAHAPFAFDGRRLVFLVREAGADASLLKLLDLETRGLRELVPERHGVPWTPAFAAGGQELWLFDGDRRIERYSLN